MARLWVVSRRWCAALSLLLCGLGAQALGEMVNAGSRPPRVAVAPARECCREFTVDALYSLAHVDTVVPLQEGLMHVPFNSEWQRHDGFALFAIAGLVVVAILAGLLSASR